MWAQMITLSVKPGTEERVALMVSQLHDAELPNSGLVRHLVFRDQADPSRLLTVAIFESEERAREREADPRHVEALGPMRETMAEVMAGPPEFLNLEVVADYAY